MITLPDNELLKEMLEDHKITTLVISARNERELLSEYFPKQLTIKFSKHLIKDQFYFQ